MNTRFRIPLVERLRARIDRLSEERDAAVAENARLKIQLAVMEQRLEVARAETRTARNQHGPTPIYATEEERLEARRLSWRLSKRRQARRPRLVQQ